MHLETHISIELAHEAGEIMVLKVSRQNPLRKIERLQDDEAIIRLSPSDERIRRRIIHHLIRFQHKRRYYIIIIIVAIIIIIKLHRVKDLSDNSKGHTQRDI